MKQIIGILILAGVFIAIFSATAIAIGWKMATFVWLTAIVISAFIVTGVFLLAS